MSTPSTLPDVVPSLVPNGVPNVVTDVATVAPAGRSSARVHAGVAALFVALAIVYTWPLLPQLTTRIASDPWDPILNATVLWWNAVTIPFSAPWWNAPQFFPSSGVSTFTENLAGISVVATPTFWLTGNPLTAYNVAFFITWPASALALYLLVHRLTRRVDAAIVGGLAYAFAPYRVAELAHLQVLSSYWLPIVLLAGHAYLETRATRWLMVFALAWLLQSTANGYFLLFGGVLLAAWFVWFGLRRDRLGSLVALATTWVVASLPLAPVLLRYQTVHAFYGMRREAYEALAFSATPQSFVQATGRLTLWQRFLPDGNDNLFPGLTVLLLIVIGLVAAAVSSRWQGAAAGLAPGPRSLRVARAALWAALALSVAATLAMLAVGPWEIAPLGIVIKMRDLNRALVVLAVAIGGLTWTSRSARAAVRRRDPLVFYAAATLGAALLCCGPVLRVGTQVVLAPAPYQWLLALPGFTELRVPTRFWMLGILCLSTAAGLVFARLPLRRPAVRGVWLIVVGLGLLADGWLGALPMAAAPIAWDALAGGDRETPVLELPLGPDYDSAATYRTVFHRRRVVNGVSGYDPAHYAPLQAGLNAHDPQMLIALASLSAYDIAIEAATDADGAWLRYAQTAPGATVIVREARGVIVHVPQGTNLNVPHGTGGEPALGPVWPLRAVEAFRHDTASMWDGKPDTEWGDNPQRLEQWVTADLGEVRRLGGVTQALGLYARDFPRQLAIEVSVDRQAWTTVWQGSTAAAAFLSAARTPRVADMRFGFTPVDARYVRLRPLAEHQNMWRVAELAVHAPPLDAAATGR